MNETKKFGYLFKRYQAFLKYLNEQPVNVIVNFLGQRENSIQLRLRLEVQLFGRKYLVNLQADLVTLQKIRNK